MTDIQDLEKIADLMKKGILTQAEFEQQKEALLNKMSGETQTDQRSQTVYVLLAFFLGLLGVHNFYAGYKGRAFFQLLLTLLSPLTLFLILPVISIWVILEMFIIKKDARGIPFEPNMVLAVILGILDVFFLLFSVGSMALGIIAGYTTAMNRYQADEILNVASKISVMSMASFSQGNIYITPEDLGDYGLPCDIYSDNSDGVVYIKDCQPSNLVNQLERMTDGKFQKTGQNSGILRF